MTPQEERRAELCARFGVPLLAVAVTLTITAAGWTVAVETRLQRVVTIVDERGPRLSGIETDIDTLYNLVRDPKPKPETKIAVEALQADIKRLDDRLTHLEDHLNDLHTFMLKAPQQGGQNFKYQPHP